MKTRSFLETKSNIASIVKARRNFILSESDNVTFSQLNNESLLTGIVNNSSSFSGNEATNQTTLQNCIPEKKVIIKTLWSHEDKNMFFTALKILGKNFNEISRFIKNRCNRSNPKNSGKTKEQVRFFYNRTWNNIKPYLKFPVELVQSVQEVYALVNYSVFRTRVKKKLNPKLGEKLNEMVMNGSTVIKCNGKRITLRTPVCPALKKMNNLTVPPREHTIPDDVILELVPRNHVTLWRVQQVEQNPRMRLKVALNRQLSDVIDFLSSKLKSNSQIIRESLSLPTVEPPRLHIRLSEDFRLQQSEVIVQEVCKPRFDDITLRSYCDNVLKASQGETHGDIRDKEADMDAVRGSEQPMATEEVVENSCVRLDLRDMRRKLSEGVGTEDARDMRLLTLYLGLGCPSTIRFLYEYLHPGDVDTAHKSVSNGLRRLLHLGKHDFLEHADNKDKKSKLEAEVADLERQVLALRQQLASPECLAGSDRPEGSSGPPSFSQPDLNDARKDVYKRQEEAIRQLLQGHPKKAGPASIRVNSDLFPLGAVSMATATQETYSDPIASVSRFHRERRHPRQQRQKAASVFTLRMPLEPLQVPVIDCGAVARQQAQYGQSSMQSLSSDLFLSQLGSGGMQTMNVQHLPSMPIQEEAAGPCIDQGDTNDSLRSFLNDINDGAPLDYQNFYPQPSFYNLVCPDSRQYAPAPPSEDSNSLSHLLNCYVKSEKN